MIVLIGFVVLYILARFAKALFKLLVYALVIAILVFHLSSCATSKCRWSAQKKQRYLIQHSKF